MIQDLNIQKQNEIFQQQLLNYSNNLILTLQNNITTLQSQLNSQKIQFESTLQSTSTLINYGLSANITSISKITQDDYLALDSKIFNNASIAKQYLQLQINTANQNILNSYQTTEQNTVRNMSIVQNRLTQNQNDMNNRIVRTRNQFDTNRAQLENVFQQKLQWARNYIDSIYMKKRDVKPPQPVFGANGALCRGSCCSIMGPAPYPGQLWIRCPDQIYFLRPDKQCWNADHML
ncbi:Hypothetical_protein [Hexamita inflata]|uniref:Hypothetical_protein n=1 Tax=Hexamita inflata TaxID=28002 RepID=A0AA86NBT6_9EUKA|nr:Hypothetical protein HINF_LOCUS4040 [Hexamita inflata]